MGVTNPVNTRNQLYTNISSDKILLGNNSFAERTFGAYGTDMVIDAGTIVARLPGSGEIVPWKADATDGTQYPAGLLLEQLTVADGEKVDTTIVNKGKVAREQIRFWYAGQDFSSVVDNRRVEDWLLDLGLEIEAADELTEFDNS